MVDIAALKVANAKRWAAAKQTRNFVSVAKSLVAAKQRYITVETRTKVPWFFVAIVHEREASQSWSGSLAQGDPWNKVSVHVPAGRGPFASWEEAACDALIDCAPFAARNTDWTIGALLTEFEKYNGLGYASRGLPSPYVWAGTDQYRSGKFVADGVFNPNVIDQQLGCAGLLMAMMAMDHSIVVGDRTIVIPEAPPLAPDAKPEPPSITQPAPGSIGAAIAKIFAAIAALFRRK